MKTAIKITQIENCLAEGTWTGNQTVAHSLINALPVDNKEMQARNTEIYCEDGCPTQGIWTAGSNLNDMNGTEATQKIAELGAITTLDIREESAPLYCQYPGQCFPQDAYLQISADGSVIADYNGEIGNAVPASVWHCRERRLTIPNRLTAKGVLQLIEDYEKQLNTIIAGMGETWDGSNIVGTLTPDATHALESIEHNLYELQDEDYDHVHVEDARNADTSSLLGDEKIHANTTDDELTEMAERIRIGWLAHIESSDLIVNGLHDHLEEIRDELRKD